MIKSFELGPYTWNVKKEVLLKDKNLGLCDYLTTTIKLSETYISDDNEQVPVSKDTLKHTFYHELTHAILYSLGHPLQDDEQFVDSFSMLLYQFEKTKKE